MGLAPLLERPPSSNEVESWFERWPKANLAVIIPGAHFVLDVDGADGGDTAYYLGLSDFDAPRDKSPMGVTCFSGVTRRTTPCWVRAWRFWDQATCATSRRQRVTASSMGWMR